MLFGSGLVVAMAIWLAKRCLESQRNFQHLNPCCALAGVDFALDNEECNPENNNVYLSRMEWGKGMLEAEWVVKCSCNLKVDKLSTHKEHLHPCLA